MDLLPTNCTIKNRSSPHSTSRNDRPAITAPVFIPIDEQYTKPAPAKKVVPLRNSPQCSRPRAQRRSGHCTRIVSVAVFVMPLPSSAVNVYVVVFFGVTCMQRFTEGHTFASGGSNFTDLALETP